MEVSGGGSRVADAFARLMSTVEKTNTSTRRLQVRKEENLSEEARRVIAGLPDLSFMQAKNLVKQAASVCPAAGGPSGAARPQREGSGSVLVRVLSASPSIGVRSAHRGRNERIDRLDHLIPNSIGLTAAWFGSCGRCRGDRDVRASVTSQGAQPL
ncbi:hypothetical protein AOLI_G00235950 [Acnodon oligacanthus]